MRSIATQRGISGRLRTSRIAFPTSRLAMTAQTNWACSMNSAGPGTSPFIMKAPIRMAVVGEPGMPSVNSGMRAALA